MENLFIFNIKKKSDINTFVDDVGEFVLKKEKHFNDKGELYSPKGEPKYTISFGEEYFNKVPDLITKGYALHETSLQPILPAIFKEDIENVKKLVEAGMEISSEFNGTTCLAMAAFKDNIEIYEYLLEKGADLKVAQEADFTPLFASVAQSHYEMTEYLLGKGEDVDKMNLNKDTIFGLSLKLKDDNKMANMLLPNIKEINTKNQEDSTYLHTAVLAGNFEMVKKIVDVEGINLEIKDISKATPLSYALMSKRDDMVKFLMSKGASLSNAKKTSLKTKGSKHIRKYIKSNNKKNKVKNVSPKKAAERGASK